MVDNAKAIKGNTRVVGSGVGNGNGNSLVHSSASCDDGWRKDTVHLLTIFPEEVWKVILRQVTDSNDLTSCANASLYFRHFILDRRVVYLFPQVVEVLAPRYAQSLDDCYREDARRIKENENADVMDYSSDHSSGDAWYDGEEEELGPNWQYPIRMTAILTCRFVCSAWNKAVENFYQGPTTGRFKMEHDLEPDIHGEFSTIDFCTNDVFCFRVPELPNKFLQRFERTHCTGCDEAPKKNPFLRRAVTFKDCQLELYPVANSYKFFQGMFRIMSKYGHELWYCTVDLVDGMPTSVDFYFQLRKWLQLMPNLKVLNLVYKMKRLVVDPDSPVGMKFILDEPVPDDLTQLEAEVLLNPLPKLEHLQLLLVKDLPTPVFNELIRRNSHISKLEVCRRKCHVEYDMHTVPLVKLNQLSLSIWSAEDLERLELTGPSWKVEKVYLLCPKSCQFLEWSRVIQILITNWSTTLTNLVLQLPIPKTEEQRIQCSEVSYSFRLILPHLQRLKLIVGAPCSLDFLLPTKDTLKHLHIIAKYTMPEDEPSPQYQVLQHNQAVEFLGFEGRMMSSNIWKVFRKLKMIKMELEGEEPWLYSDTVYTPQKTYRLG